MTTSTIENVMQADVMEILYRAAKQDTLKDGGIAFQGHPKVKAIFDALVSKPVQVCSCQSFTTHSCCALMRSNSYETPP